MLYSRFNLLLVLLALSASLAFSGCRSKPRPLQPWEVAERKADFLIRHAGNLDQRQIDLIHRLPDTPDPFQLNRDLNRVMTVGPAAFEVDSDQHGKRRRVLGRTVDDLYYEIDEHGNKKKKKSKDKKKE